MDTPSQEDAKVKQERIQGKIRLIIELLSDIDKKIKPVVDSAEPGLNGSPTGALITVR